MNSHRHRIGIFVCTAAMVLVTRLNADDPAQDSFTPLFNGRDLAGWVRVNTAESTWRVEDDRLVCSGKPIGELRTDRMYQNFILELEWRHMVPGGNAGVFVWADDITAKGVPFHRSIEVQVLENAYGNNDSHTTHGDIFPIHGATMTPLNGRGGSRAFPTEFRSKPSPEWNHYRIECRDGSISLAVNGKVVTQGLDAIPRKGYICLESEGGVVHYRNIRIQELPDTPLDPNHVAIADRRLRSMYNGLDLSEWRVSGAGWSSQDWVLQHRGTAAGTLSSLAQIGDAAFVVDFRVTDPSRRPSISLRGVELLAEQDQQGAGIRLSPNQWNRLEGHLRESRLTMRLNGQLVVEEQPVEPSPQGPLTLECQSDMDFANLYTGP